MKTLLKTVAVVFALTVFFGYSIHRQKLANPKPADSPEISVVDSSNESATYQLSTKSGGLVFERHGRNRIFANPQPQIVSIEQSNDEINGFNILKSPYFSDNECTLDSNQSLDKTGGKINDLSFPPKIDFVVKKGKISNP